MSLHLEELQHLVYIKLHLYEVNVHMVRYRANLIKYQNLQNSLGAFHTSL